ncbi:MAG: hypothetical protein IKC81_00440 [Paludibacteraceae bacterium]|nr:hypothetical protein [Paludibacteraceae bacterium]
MMANIQELLSEIDSMQEQLTLMKQHLALIDATMQAERAELQASKLRVKQLEMVVGSKVEGQKSKVESQCKVSAEGKRSLDYAEPQPDFMSGANKVEGQLCVGDDLLHQGAEELPKRPNNSTDQQLKTDSPTQQISESPSRDARIITDLRKAIGLNDRFRLKHDLFDNNEMLLFETIDALNAMNSLAEADAYLKQHFEWKADDATVVYFYEILERKFFRP